MEMIMMVLIILLFAQIFLVMRKSKSINHLGNLSKINELMFYTDNMQTDVTDEAGMDVLMIACSNNMDLKKGEFGYFDVVKKAVSKGFDMNAKSLSSGKTPLMYAVRNKDGLDRAEHLVSAGANVNIEDDDGRIVLFDAVKRADNRYYDLVVDKVLNINHQDSYGVNALMIAAYRMNIARIEDLLDRGADAKLRNNANENAYDVASRHIGRHIRRAIESRNEDEGSNPNNIISAEDVLAAQRHNHKVREMVRRLECIVLDKEYEYKKFKRPFLNTEKAK